MDQKIMRIQKGGTCWFHAALNGWLLSDVGSTLLRSMLGHYKDTHQLASFKHALACPVRGQLPLNYFWSYVEFMFQGNSNNKVNPWALTVRVGHVVKNAPANVRNMSVLGYLRRNAMHRDMFITMALENFIKNPYSYSNAQLVRSMGLRNFTVKNVTFTNILNILNVPTNVRTALSVKGVNSINKVTMNLLGEINGPGVNSLRAYISAPPESRNNLLQKLRYKRVSGGSLTDVHTFCRIIFGSAYHIDFTKDPGTLVVALPLERRMSKPIQKVQDKYLISHAFFGASDSRTGHGHAITAFVDANDEEWIYDSNEPTPVRTPWTKDRTKVKKWFFERGYDILVPRACAAFYVREDASFFTGLINATGARRNVIAKFTQAAIAINTGRNLNTVLEGIRLYYSMPNNIAPELHKSMLVPILNASKRIRNAINRAPNAATAAYYKNRLLNSKYNSVGYLQNLRRMAIAKHASFANTRRNS